MRKARYFIFAILCSFLCVSCGEEVRYENIPFELNNIYSNIQNLPDNQGAMGVYYFEEELHKHYHVAISSSGDLEKVVDFSKNFAIAITDVKAKSRRLINITEVLKKESVLYVKYTIENQGSISFSARPCLVASISREYMGCEIAFFDVTGTK